MCQFRMNLTQVYSARPQWLCVSRFEQMIGFSMTNLTLFGLPSTKNQPVDHAKRTLWIKSIQINLTDSGIFCHIYQTKSWVCRTLSSMRHFSLYCVIYHRSVLNSTQIFAEKHLRGTTESESLLYGVILLNQSGRWYDKYGRCMQETSSQMWVITLGEELHITSLE